MPGTPSGENHSSESQTCGRTPIPRPSSSEYRRFTPRCRGERSMDSFRSQKRSERSSSSDRRVHGRGAARFLEWGERLATTARLRAACANERIPSREWREKLSNVDGAVCGQWTRGKIFEAG